MKKTKTFTRRTFLQSTAVTGLGLTLSLYSCKKSSSTPIDSTQPDKDDDKKPLKITDISLSSHVDLVKESEFIIVGKGFAQGDIIVFESLINSFNGKYSISSKAVSENNITIQLPAELISDSYRISVERGNESFFLGNTVFNFVFNPNIPDREGMSIKGSVYASGKGIANVVVSDGFEIAVTDEKGIYYLPSKKKTNYVFISIPANYEVATEGSAPKFFKKLSQPSTTVEIKDFELIASPNEQHAVMVLGDMHLANRNDDISQFQQGFLVDVNQSIQSYKNKGLKVYALTLGDMTWDTYWHSNKYALPEYLREMNKINTTVFNTMGNHDNNPDIRSDWEAEDKYRDIIGPTYYSFNIGKVHYIVLDNTEYINAINDPRGYKARIVDEQLEWLKKDLSTIEDKSTPIVIAMHIQLNTNPGLDTNGNETTSYRLEEAPKFVNALNSFTNVHLLTGHTHMNYNIETSPKLMEHNIGAVCATWWWTGRNGYAGNHICKDGTPGGYCIWEVDNKDIKWAYKSIGKDINYQFRAYDLNEIHLTKDKYAPKYTGTNWNKYAADYVTPNKKNEVLINVWNYDSEWKIEITENGQNLPVVRVHTYDPLHIISYSAKRLDANAEPTASFVTAKSAHLFKVKASSALSTLDIKVTDRFGNVYSEKMIRPKAFGYNMK